MDDRLRFAVEPYQELFVGYLRGQINFREFDETFRERFNSGEVAVGSNHAMSRMLRFFAELDNTCAEPDRNLDEITPEELKPWVADLLRDSGFDPSEVDD